jgi:hypothetical protein
MSVGMNSFLVPLIAASISLSGSILVAWAVYRANRKQARTQTTLDLQKEYYSPEMAEA